MKTISRLILSAAALAFAQPVAAQTNIIPGNVSSISTVGVDGVLRAGSIWAGSFQPSNNLVPADGVFAPEGQTWLNGSFWWDADPSVNNGPVYWIVQLSQLFTVDRFVVQADDNDSYLLEYWDGGSWQTAWNIATLPSFGLVTRDSGLLGPITTDAFRFSATSGDNYYAVSEIQAFAAVPEPGTWALLIAGFALCGAALRIRRRRVGELA